MVKDEDPLKWILNAILEDSAKAPIKITWPDGFSVTIKVIPGEQAFLVEPETSPSRGKAGEATQ